MITTVLGATGRTGRLVVRHLLDSGQEVRVLVRDADKARELFGAQSRLTILRGSLSDPVAVGHAFAGSDTAFVALGSIGMEGNLQRVAIEAASRSSMRQYLRLSVLNAGEGSLGINQRAHSNIDFAAQVAGIPYATLRPAIFSASALVAAPEIRAQATWTGLADTGRVGLIDHRDVADAAFAVLTDESLWGAHYDLTGPELLSWPGVMALLSDELQTPVRFEVAEAFALVLALREAGVSSGQAELLVAREWALQAGENERLTDLVYQLTGHAPRPVSAFLHENRGLFLGQ